jgi:hypothetical protein
MQPLQRLKNTILKVMRDSLAIILHSKPLALFGRLG